MKEELIIVEKLAIDLQIQSKLTSKQIMKDTELFVYKNVLPVLEKILLTYKFNGDLRINAAELEIDLKSLSTSKSVFGLNEAQLETELKRKLDHLILSRIASKKPIPEDSKSFVEILIFFLSHGTLPWFVPRNYNLDVEFRRFLKTKNRITSQKQLFSQLKITFQKNPKTFLRFIKQIENDLLFQILTYGQQNAFSPLERKGILAQAQTKNRVLVWALVFYKAWYLPSKSTTFLLEAIPELRKSQASEIRSLTKALSFLGKTTTETIIDFKPTKNKVNDFELFQRLFNKNLKENDLLTFLKKVNVDNVRQKPTEKLDEKEAVEKQAVKYIDNAGLIIIYPFLQNFYKKIRVLDQNNGISKEKYDLAIHALHYLSSGKTLSYESDMVFEKFLCGVPLDFPVNRFLALEESVKEEANILLMAVTDHWEKLKNTSPEGLRELFFTREGKLELESSRLTINRMAQDILLESLPWNLTIVKFPWLKKSLFVHW